MSSTLVGVCDGELDDSKYRSSFITNKVGGLPDVVPGLPRAFPRCERCSAPLVHVVQVYCPLEESPYHRSLQLFACPAAGCGLPDSWTALRSQSLEVDGKAARTPGDPEPSKEAPLSASDWCDSADDWGMAEDEEEEKDLAKPVPEEEKVPEDLMSCQLAALHLAEPPPDVPVLRPFFISVVDEQDAWGEDDEEARSHAEQLLRDYERREGALAGQPDDGEKYERSRAPHGDRSFSRFRKRIATCPQQILRYCRGGRPLFISEPPADERASPCANCGGPLTFELQLMPALVGLLSWKVAVASGDGSPPDFGTVLVYTCARSCWTSSERRPVREVCVVQMDPDHRLFK